MRGILLMLLASTLLVPVAFAQYRCVEDGKTIFTVKPCPLADGAGSSGLPTQIVRSGMTTWAQAIKAKIRVNLSLPPNTPQNAHVVCRVSQLPSGEVLQVAIASSSGIRGVDEAVLRAIYKSSPLPKPSEPEYFSRELEISWRNSD